MQGIFAGRGDVELLIVQSKDNDAEVWVYVFLGNSCLNDLPIVVHKSALTGIVRDYGVKHGEKA